MPGVSFPYQNKAEVHITVCPQTFSFRDTTQFKKKNLFKLRFGGGGGGLATLHPRPWGHPWTRGMTYC